MAKYYTIKYDLHHSADFLPPVTLFIAKNDMDDADLVALVTELFFTSVGLQYNADGDPTAFAKWVITHQEAIRKWIFGVEDIDVSISVDSMAHGGDCCCPNLFCLEGGTNRGFVVDGGSKYDTIWFQITDRDAEYAANVEELSTRPIGEVIARLAKSML